jgi:uncharacterized membrane protein
MVRIRDDGVFDAPIDRVWKYWNDNAAHNHTSFQVTKVLEQKGNAMTVMAKIRNSSGAFDTDKLLMTVNQPKGFSVEYLSGSMKGSKQTHTYTSQGNKTRVDVDGEFVSPGVADNDIKKGVLAYFAQAFEEDNANLKKYK